jgi:hypothetical protein
VESFPAVLAYFGPDVQLPVISFIAAVSGLLLTIGGAPIRAFKRWLAARKEKRTLS